MQTVTSETTRDEWNEMVGPAPTMTPSRLARLKRIGERVECMILADYYDEHDKDTIRRLCRDGIALVEIELLLLFAEQDLRESLRKAHDAKVERLSFHPGEQIKFGPDKHVPTDEPVTGRAKRPIKEI